MCVNTNDAFTVWVIYDLTFDIYSDGPIHGSNAENAASFHADETSVGRES